MKSVLMRLEEAVAMVRRERALKKIRRLDKQLDTASYRAAATIEREINRLQSVYGITLEEIEGPKDYRKMFPFLSEEIIKAGRQTTAKEDN